ncbi:MAG: hypothetical protein KAQ83_04530 [Nanoarchaeota archaeon]|nr:hypothetical protein [Nanoarchaeota archaeon]
MGFLDKIPFMKKKEDPFNSPSSGLDDDPFKTDIGNNPLSGPDPLANTPSQFDNPNFDSMQQTRDGINSNMDEDDGESLMTPAEIPPNLPGQPAHQTATPANQTAQPNNSNPRTNNNGYNNNSNVPNHQIELILSKLDTIKLNIENINLRLNKIENEIQTQKKSKNSW